MKKVIFILIVLCSCEYRMHTCEIEYCTGEVDTVEIGSRETPCYHKPSNYKMAVPEWHGYLNVCRVKHISDRSL